MSTPPTIVTPDQTRDLAANFAAQLANQGQDSQAFTNEAGISARDWALLRDPVLHTERLEAIRQKKGYIIDMDGVIYHVSH
jgi:NagD protein